MTKRNIKLGLIAAFLVGVTFALSGCTKNEEQKNTQENQEQTQEQAPTQDQAQNQNRESKKMMTTPREAIEACANKNEGDACEVSMQKRNTDKSEEKQITGSCEKVENKDELFCMLAVQNGPGGEGAKRPIGAPAGTQAETQAETEASE